MEALLNTILARRQTVRDRIKANASDPRYAAGIHEELVTLNILLSRASEAGLVPVGMKIWDDQY